ncbi:hypothetical protein TNCV_463271 [Trichonephila clavipes]|nr:hypothetical protein TNCV_463271 [Trichonephila clavipes]
MDSCPAYHEFEPSTTEDWPCRGNRCTLNMSRLKRPLVGVVLKLEEWRGERCLVRVFNRRSEFMAYKNIRIVPKPLGLEVEWLWSRACGRRCQIASSSSRVPLKNPNLLKVKSSITRNFLLGVEVCREG